jgi:hypothetical protein
MFGGFFLFPGGHMRVDYTTEATLGEGFASIINVEIDEGDVSDIQVFSKTTGENVTDLIYGGPTWEQAWSIAERRVIYLPSVQKEIQRTFRSQTYDTPFRG